MKENINKISIIFGSMDCLLQNATSNILKKLHIINIKIHKHYFIRTSSAVYNFSMLVYFKMFTLILIDHRKGDYNKLLLNYDEICKTRISQEIMCIFRYQQEKLNDSRYCWRLKF